MDLVTPLMQTLQANANLEHTESVTQDTRALAQQRLLNTQLLGIKMQQNQNTLQAVQQYFSGQSPTDPSMEPAPNDTPLQAAQKNLVRMQRDANMQRGAAMAIARAGGDPSVVDKMMDNATQASHWSAYAAREVMQQRKSDSDMIASIASTVLSAKDDDAARTGYQRIVVMDPQLAQSLSVDRDASGGVIYGPKTETTMQTLNGVGITAGKQADLALKVQAEQRRASDLERKVSDDARKQQDTDSRVALHQSQANASDALAEQRRIAKAAPGTGSAKPLTGPQQRTNAEIDEARNEAAAIPDTDLAKYYDQFTQESLRNPKMQNVLQKAATRKYGEDPDYEGVRARLSPASHQLGKPASAPATTPAGAPASDAAMNAQTAPLTPAQIQTVAKMKGVAPVLNDDDFDKLPSGRRFIGPDGRIRTKP